VKALILIAALISTAAEAQSVTVLNPGKPYLAQSCGGQTVNEYANGLNPLTAGVTVTTRCNGSGRGSKSRSYINCYLMQFGLEGDRISSVLVGSGSWLQGAPAYQCPFNTNPAYSWTDGDTALTTESVAAVYRAVLSR
jgi:hypothetical protein